MVGLTERQTDLLRAAVLLACVKKRTPIESVDMKDPSFSDDMAEAIGDLITEGLKLAEGLYFDFIQQARYDTALSQFAAEFGGERAQAVNKAFGRWIRSIPYVEHEELKRMLQEEKEKGYFSLFCRIDKEVGA